MYKKVKNINKFYKKRLVHILTKIYYKNITTKMNKTPTLNPTHSHTDTQTCSKVGGAYWTSTYM